MRRELVLFWLAVCALLPIGIRSANGATINAASCSLEAVQSAVNSSSTGDVVAVPAGSCTWPTALDVRSSKRIVLQGNGIGVTIVTAGTSQSAVVRLGESGSRVSGFTFVDGNISVHGKNWRIDHNRFEYACASGGAVHAAILPIADVGLGYTESIKGLIDHNQFHNMRIVVSGGPSLMANEVWSRPLGLGTDEAVYVEDNTFTYAICTTIQAIDANYGGAYVFRHNQVQDASLMAHAVQGNNRATRKWEVYNNVFRAVNQAGFPGFMRAGTGVWFNNELVGEVGYGNGKWGLPHIIMDEQRSCGTWGDAYNCRTCNGSSPWDGNQNGQGGYPCRDQIGRSTDTPKWISTLGSEGTYTQALEPAYAWNNFIYSRETDRVNKTNGVAVELRVKSDICPEAKAHIVAGRDFINNGITPKPGYTPYTYPHPLSKPTPPSNLRTPAH